MQLTTATGPLHPILYYTPAPLTRRELSGFMAPKSGWLRPSKGHIGSISITHPCYGFTYGNVTDSR